MKIDTSKRVIFNEKKNESIAMQYLDLFFNSDEEYHSTAKILQLGLDAIHNALNTQVKGKPLAHRLSIPLEGWSKKSAPVKDHAIEQLELAQKDALKYEGIRKAEAKATAERKKIKEENKKKKIILNKETELENIKIEQNAEMLELQREEELKLKLAEIERLKAKLKK